MAFTYWLPGKDGEKQEFNTTNNAVIIIGANGSGKSKLGAWIEQQDFAGVHRISAQRNLNFGNSIQLLNYDDAESMVFYGTLDEGVKKNHDKGYRWEWGNSYTTKLLDDFGYSLSALLALRSNEVQKFYDACKEAEKAKQKKPDTSETVLDRLTLIWDKVLPQRRLIIEDSKIYASFIQNEKEVRYSANQMSDGERAVLYLSSQVLCVPPNKTLIIDEPEVHLHRTIMNRLWHALEQSRPDCLFIYITHDTQFAAMHSGADKIWIKEYNGLNWVFEKVDGCDLPEELLLEILGSRKNVLFVEGESSSLDAQLYSALYPDYLIVPCGSCLQVVERTKAFRNNPSLHDCEVYGIIDRDYRSDYEIEKYKKDHIFPINVAEVENLFIVEEIIRLIALHMAKNQEEVFDAVKKYVINERFAKQINGQICAATVAQIKYLLMNAEISKKDDAEAKSSLDAVINGINYDAIHKEKEREFMNALENENYADIIRIYNCKNISDSIGHLFGIENKEYRKLVIGLLYGERKQVIIDALTPYMPPDIPRNTESVNIP